MRLPVIALTLALAWLLQGCALYHRTDTTQRGKSSVWAWSIGTGKRTFVVPQQVAISHSELPETFKAAGELAGVAAATAAKGGL